MKFKSFSVTVIADSARKSIRKIIYDIFFLEKIVCQVFVAKISVSVAIPLSQGRYGGYFSIHYEHEKHS